MVSLIFNIVFNLIEIFIITHRSNVGSITPQLITHNYFSISLYL